MVLPDKKISIFFALDLCFVLLKKISWFDVFYLPGCFFNNSEPLVSLKGERSHCCNIPKQMQTYLTAKTKEKFC